MIFDWALLSVAIIDLQAVPAGMPGPLFGSRAVGLPRQDHRHDEATNPAAHRRDVGRLVRPLAATAIALGGFRDKI